MSDRRMRPIHIYNYTKGGYFDPKGCVLEVAKVMTDGKIERTGGSIEVGAVMGYEVPFHIKAILIRGRDNVIALPAKLTPSQNRWTRPIDLYVTWSNDRYGFEISGQRPRGAIN